MPAGSTKKYELLLIAVIAARATSFIFSKMILESLTPFNLLAVRFIIAFILLALIFNTSMDYIFCLTDEDAPYPRIRD